MRSSAPKQKNCNFSFQIKSVEFASEVEIFNGKRLQKKTSVLNDL